MVMPTPVTSPAVLVEVLLLRHDPAEGFGYRRVLTALDQRARPDGTARSLALLDPDDDRSLVHSTSWRVTDDGEIILTYLVHPDPDPDQPGKHLSDPRGIARATGPGHPTPAELSVDQVAAHAIRHLAFLGRTDPGVAAYLTGRPRIRRALESVPGTVAGQFDGAREAVGGGGRSA